MEDVMSNYSELVVFFLMLPVATQIIVPLLMLLGWGFVCVKRTVSGRQKIMDGLKDHVKISEELQFSRS
jgi:hypothetical protein